MTRVELRTATGDDLDRVVSLLEAAGLPTADVRDGAATFYLGRRPGGRAPDPVATGGLEPAGDATLLRSIVVAPDARGRGVGRTLVAELEARAAGADCYLLTTDATGFFARLGYERVDRADAPEGVRRTRQFEGVCPGSATVLYRRLPEPSA